MGDKLFDFEKDDLDKYVEHKNDLFCLDQDKEPPSIIKFENGIYIIGKTYTKCKEIEDVILANNTIVNLGGISSLPDSEIAKIKNWDAEKYRKRI